MALGQWIRAGVIALAGLAATACASYPDAPRYSTRPMTGVGTGAPPVAPTANTPTPPVYEAPPPTAAPVERIDGGALPPRSEEHTSELQSR